MKAERLSAESAGIPGRPEGGGFNQRQRILIVDDELDVRALVAFHLQGDGFDVMASADGEHGRFL